MIDFDEKNLEKIKQELEDKICKDIICGCNILEVQIGTNGFKGGDASYGSRTYFSLTNEGGTFWYVVIHLSNGQKFVFEPEKIEIFLAGDSELETFAKALKFASEKLSTYVKE